MTHSMVRRLAGSNTLKFSYVRRKCSEMSTLKRLFNTSMCFYSVLSPVSLALRSLTVIECTDSQKIDGNPLLDPFFNYTSGRWLWDEASRLRTRHQPFDVDGLKAVASKAVNARLCTDITKLPEGSYNKVFLLTMDNGVQVVARIPNPYLPPRVTTASEVATLDFLRTELEIPVPRVLAWSNRKDQPVKAEYIIMEKAPGEELGKSWMAMDISEKVNIVSQLATIQAKTCSVDFKSYGSVYYNGDVDGCQPIAGVSNRFCIGPSAAISFWEAEREAMDRYRGPCEHLYMKPSLYS